MINRLIFTRIVRLTMLEEDYPVANMVAKYQLQCVRFAYCFAWLVEHNLAIGLWGADFTVNLTTKKRLHFCNCLILSGKRDSNSRPQPWQGCALPTELFPHYRLNFTTDISIELRVQRYSIFIYFQNFLRKILKKCIFIYLRRTPILNNRIIINNIHQQFFSCIFHPLTTVLPAHTKNTHKTRVRAT